MVNAHISKYLQSVRRVDDIQWVCQTFNNHLKKGRVPSCAIDSGMQFLEKPFFFDPNELDRVSTFCSSVRNSKDF